MTLSRIWKAIRAEATSSIRDSGGLVRTSIGLGGITAISMVAGLGLSVVLARSLGVQAYGQYIFVLTIAHILSLLATMGLPTLIIRQTAVYQAQAQLGELNGLLKWSARLVIASSLVFFVGLVAVLTILDVGETGRWQTRILYLLVGPLVFAIAFVHLNSAILKANDKVTLGFVPDGVIRPLVLLAALILVQFVIVLTPTSVMVLHIMASALAALWAAHKIRRHYDHSDHVAVRQTVPVYAVRAWLKSLFPLTIITASTLVNSYIDIFMLGVLTDDTSHVALYRVGANLASLCIVGASLVHWAATPRFAKFYAAGQRSEAAQIVRRAMFLGFTSIVISVVVIFLAGSNLVMTIFGAEYQAAKSVLWILASGYLVIAFLGPVNMVVQMTGQYSSIAQLTVATACLNAAMNFLLIPAYQEVGAAVTTAVTLVIIHTFMAWIARKKAGVNTTAISMSAFGQSAHG